MATQAAANNFFASARYAVVGASSNTKGFGNKIFQWYLDYDLDVTPVHYKESSVTAGGKAYPAINDINDLKDPKNTSLSIVVNPVATLELLGKAKALGIPSIWMQPGTYDDAVLKSASDGSFENVVYGDGGKGHDGWCVLVDGPNALKSAGKL